MSDPAAAAVRRAYELGEYDCLDQMEATAREALKPLKEVHFKRTVRSIGFGDQPVEDICAECSTVGTHVGWPCRTAQLIYAEAEL